MLSGFRETNHGEPLRVHRFHEGWAMETYTGQVSNSAGLWTGQLLFMPDAEGTTPDTLLSYEDLRAEPYEPGLHYFAPAPLWTVCGSRIAVLNPLDSVVTTIDADGAGGSLQIPLPLPPMTSELIETWVDRRLDVALLAENITLDEASRPAMRRQALAETIESAADVQPPTKILCDESGTLWVQGFSVDTDVQGYGREWAVFEADLLVGFVRFPPRVWPLFFRDGEVIAVWRDELDVEHLVRMATPRSIGP